MEHQSTEAKVVTEEMALASRRQKVIDDGPWLPGSTWEECCACAHLVHGNFDEPLSAMLGDSDDLRSEYFKKRREVDPTFDRSAVVVVAASGDFLDRLLCAGKEKVRMLKERVDKFEAVVEELRSMTHEKRMDRAIRAIGGGSIIDRVESERWAAVERKRWGTKKNHGRKYAKAREARRRRVKAFAAE